MLLKSSSVFNLQNTSPSASLQIVSSTLRFSASRNRAGRRSWEAASLSPCLKAGPTKPFPTVISQQNTRQYYNIIHLHIYTSLHICVVYIKNSSLLVGSTHPLVFKGPITQKKAITEDEPYLNIFRTENSLTDFHAHTWKDQTFHE